MGILSGNPKDEPLHYGEVFDIWAFSTKAKGCISVYRAYKNHAGDKDLKKILDDLISQAELEAKECDEILLQNGLVPSPMLPDRPDEDLKGIPIGARLTDMEITPLMAADTAASMVACSQIMGMTIREDVGMLFGKYHMTKAALGLKILKMSKEKGWLIPPPLHVRTPELVEA